MAGRKREDEAASFDSLLDTMTNVVGILVIVLVITQLGVARAVKRIEENLPRLTEEELAVRQRATAARSVELAKREAEWTALAAAQEADRVRRTALAKELAELRRKLAPDPAHAAEIERLRRELAAQQKTLLAQQQNVAALLKDRTALEAQLARTPERPAPPARIIPMPDPRPAPAGSQAVIALCRFNRVAIVPLEQVRETAFQRLRTVRTMVMAGGAPGNQQGRTDKDELLCDAAKVRNFFQRQDVGTPDFRFNAAIVPEKRQKSLLLELRPNGGEPAGRLAAPTSRFTATVRGLIGQKKHVLFQVCPDSFEAYIEARQVCDRLKVPAGWNVQWGPQWGTSMPPLFKIKGEAPPPPPTPPPKDAPPAKPRNDLD